jgi:serine/threonine-protein kinase
VAKKNAMLQGTAARPGALLVAGVLGLLAAGWAAFQWWQLVVARSGGEIFCAPGGGGHCAEVWDSPFAAAVHAYTGMPVAAWGVAWALVAAAAPLLARARLAQRRDADAWLGATAWTAITGVLGVALLLGASLRFGHVCATCVGTYALTLVYALAAGAGLGFAVPRGLASGAGLVAGGVALSFALLLWPALRTPQNPNTLGARAIGDGAPVPKSTPDDQELARLLREVPEPVRQLISDMLADYAAHPAWTPPPPRAVIGPPGARLVLTEWFDTLCSHCAELHEALKQLRERLGSDTFSLASHHYPLDGSCNPNITRIDPDAVSCTSARAQICAEGRPGAFELSGELFANQRTLTAPLVLEIAGRYVPPAELAACMASPETEAKLQADIAWAQQHRIEGTPMVLINGRKVLPFPPLLYALALTRGSPTNPAFAALPPPKPLPTHDH